MPLHHSRRRRVLTEDPAAAAAPAVATGSGSSGSKAKEAYASAARREQQPHVTDLVPLAWWSLALWLLAGIAAIAGLETAYAWLPELTERLGAASVAPCDLTSPVSLARWFSSVLLGAGSVLAVLVYRLRSHKIDDYRGRYRMWRWVVPAGLVLSVDEICHLDQLAGGLVALASRGSTLALDPGTLWVIGCAVLWGLAALRLLVEIRHNRLASVLLVVAAADLIALATLGLWSCWDLSPPRPVMLLAGLRMGGHVLLLAALALYARHVILDAEGRLKRKKKPGKGTKRKRKTEADSAAAGVDGESSGAAASKAGSKLVVDGPHKMPGAPTQRSESDSRLAAARPNSGRQEAAEPRASASATGSTADEDDNDEDGDRGMTRAERKRLKRLGR